MGLSMVMLRPHEIFFAFVKAKGAAMHRCGLENTVHRLHWQKWIQKVVAETLCFFYIPSSLAIIRDGLDCFVGRLNFKCYGNCGLAPYL